MGFICVQFAFNVSQVKS